MPAQTHAAALTFSLGDEVEEGKRRERAYMPELILSLVAFVAHALRVLVYLLAVQLERAHVLLRVLEELVPIRFIPYIKFSFM